jgi:tetratricopeptide (TPR) repeat protein
MSNKEWYRGDEWDNETQDLFEKKLKRSRGSYNKSQYIRIKATYLLKSVDLIKQFEGCTLMERIINDYPEESSSVIFACEKLGDYYLSVEKFEKAEAYYRSCISLYKKNGRSGSSGIVDIKLAETSRKVCCNIFPSYS